MDLTILESMGGKKAIKGLLEIDSGAKVIVSSVYSTDSKGCCKTLWYRRTEQDIVFSF